MAKDYYKILGINKNASQDEIKKAYRKAAIEWHPDKFNGKSDKEKKEAEERFKDIAEAHEVLSNPEKRKKYDQFGENWDKVNTGGFGGFEDIMGDFGFDIFGRNKSQKPRGPIPGETITLNYFISIEEIFNGVNKKIKVNIDSRCPECNGTGGDVEECTHCNGTGYFVKRQQTLFGISTIQTTCPYCHGTGKIIKNRCHHCNNGFVKKEREININIKPFVQNGYTMKYTGMGSESKDKNGLNGDLYIQVIYNVDKSKYVIQENNVYEKLYIPYYDCILGTDKKVILPNDKEKTITIKPLSINGDKVILPGEGINGGSYIFIIEPELPKRSLSNKLSDKEKELLQKIKKLHS